MHRIPLFFALFACFACENGASDEPRSDITTSLEAARTDISIPFELDVTCTIGNDKHALKVIRGQVGIWQQVQQFTLSSDERSDLLGALVDAGFADFQPSYGEKSNDERKAPVRISCRVHIEIEGFEKTSVQAMDGEQSKELLSLAESLVGIVEESGQQGTAADNLADGLAKLANGTLAPEVLELRFLQTAGDGFILRIDGGVVSRQPYTPGEIIGDIEHRELTSQELEQVTAALAESGFPAWPLNLQADDLMEIEIGVLGRRKTISARATFRPAPPETQSDLDKILTLLQQL